MSGRPCPYGECDGAGFIVDEQTRTARPCRCRDQLVAAARTRGLSAAIPRRYRDVAFERPPVTQIDDRIVREVRRFCVSVPERLDRGEGLWLQGPPGTGKTTLAMLVSKAALDAGRTVAVYSLPRLLAEIRTTYSEDAADTYTGLLDRLAAVDLLHLDDVGAEKTSPWVLEQLYAIVNTRYEDQRSIVLTTNITDPDELVEQIGARTVSRLKQMCVLLPLHGADSRPAPFAVT